MREEFSKLDTLGRQELMSLDRCGDTGGERHLLHMNLARLREPPTPIFHPEHKARGECSPFKFQSASITPVSYSKNIWPVSPRNTPMLPPFHQPLPGFSGLPGCVPIDSRKLPARKTGV